MGREDRISSPGGVETERRENVAILRITPSESGGLTQPMRHRFMASFKQLLDDPAIAAVVVIGGGVGFLAGTSLEPLDTPEAAPNLPTLCNAIEASPKPVVAAIEGAAMGNGLELALAAHFRLATASARMGAPEITLGLVPSGGATQRLPKLIGGPMAFRFMLSGRSVTGEAAAKIGLIDGVIAGDVLEAAVTFASDVVTRGSDLHRNSERRDRLGDSAAFLDAARQYKEAAERSGSDAALRLIECLEAALLLPYDIGLGLEAAAFSDLVDSDESRALRRVVVAERQLQARTAKIGRVPSRPLNAVAVLAARGLGNEVAVSALDAGFSVTVAERTEEALEAGVTRIIEHYDARVASGRMTEEAVEATLDRMHAVCGYATLGEVDIVVDPGPTIARARVGEIDGVLKAGAILATGSEQVDLARIAGSTGRRSDVVGLKHYPGFLKNRVVELSSLDDTSPRAIETARAFARKLGRLIVETGPSAQGIGTTISNALHAAADTAAIEGAAIGQVDDALRRWGIPLGSFAWRDARGFERSLRARQSGDVDSRLAAMGRTGRQTGRGFYSYPKRGEAGVEDPDVLSLIADMRRERGITPRQLGERQIQTACLAAMVGAGAELLMDGTAKRPSDIDMVAIHGLGFARQTGGIMFAADVLGLPRIKEVLTRLSNEDDRIVSPPSIFDDLIRAGKGFSALED